MNIFDMYEDLKKYIKTDYDDLFYEAPEGEVQIEILKTILGELINSI